MADAREDILVRLLAIIEGVSGFTTALRNKPGLSDVALPGIVLFDGDEEVDERSASRTRPANRPVIVNMAPTIRMEINGTPETIGTTASEHRATLIDTITADSTLLAMLHNGEMSYDGSQMALVTNGRELIYQMDVNFTFTYAMIPGRLTGT